MDSVSGPVIGEIQNGDGPQNPEGRKNNPKEEHSEINISFCSFHPQELAKKKNRPVFVPKMKPLIFNKFYFKFLNTYGLIET